jgi:hypothetical protein
MTSIAADVALGRRTAFDAGAAALRKRLSDGRSGSASGFRVDPGPGDVSGARPLA